MKINTKTFIKTIKTLLIILAFSFTTNGSASTTISSPIANNVSVAASTNLLAISAQTHALTWNWGWIKNWFKNFKCSRCGRKHGGKCGGGNNGGGTGVPLDGGLSLLLGGAVFFGIRKLRGTKK